MISKKLETAKDLLDEAIEAKPENFMFYWAKGLVLRRMNKRDEAILSFRAAAELAPDTPTLYYHIGVVYYNIGIDLRQAAMTITENDEFREIRKQYLDKFREAVTWLERSYELDPTNEKTISRLNQLYYQLDMKEEQKALELISD